jgi:hypothetical protein
MFGRCRGYTNKKKLGQQNTPQQKEKATHLAIINDNITSFRSSTMALTRVNGKTKPTPEHGMILQRNRTRRFIEPSPIIIGPRSRILYTAETACGKNKRIRSGTLSGDGSSRRGMISTASSVCAGTRATTLPTPG